MDKNWLNIYYIWRVKLMSLQSQPRKLKWLHQPSHGHGQH